MWADTGRLAGLVGLILAYALCCLKNSDSYEASPASWGVVPEGSFRKRLAESNSQSIDILNEWKVK